MQRVLTGIQSTGVPHLGNLLGAMRPALQLTQHHTAFFFIANLHTLTTQQDPEKISRYTYATAAAWLAAGLDPQKNLLYRQSHIPEVCELTWYLTCFTSYSTLNKAHAFKAKKENLQNVSAALFQYPILMAADILLYDATHIPVGQDQVQHIEIARKLATTFNHQYGDVFQIPQPHITHPKPIPGTDGRKMSKSYHNTINIFVQAKELTNTIMRIQTDSRPLHSPKDPTTCPLFQLYETIATPQQTEILRQRYLAGGYGYQTAKKELLELILDTFREERRAYAYYLQNIPLLEQTLQQGEAQARHMAYKKLKNVRKVLGLHSSPHSVT